jgi:hypothetical protein
VGDHRRRRTLEDHLQRPVVVEVQFARLHHPRSHAPLSRTQSAEERVTTPKAERPFRCIVPSRSSFVGARCPGPLCVSPSISLAEEIAKSWNDVIIGRMLYQDVPFL